MTVTIQKELADRIMAAPNSKDYGALSVWIQSMCRVELVRLLPPTVFWPRPKVHSAIIKIILEPDRRAAIPDLQFFHQFARSIFFHRRKFLRSVAISAFKERLSKRKSMRFSRPRPRSGSAERTTVGRPTARTLRTFSGGSSRFNARTVEFRNCGGVAQTEDLGPISRRLRAAIDGGGLHDDLRLRGDLRLRDDLGLRGDLSIGGCSAPGPLRSGPTISPRRRSTRS